MAYRPLVEGDYVKIICKDTPDAFGRFGTVTRVDGRVVYVDYTEWRNGFMPVINGFSSNRLILAVKPEEQYKFTRDVFSDVVDDEPECPYDGWDRDDLIERILYLEAVVEENC
jgi:hypothetical protein